MILISNIIWHNPETGNVVGACAQFQLHCIGSNV